MPRLDTQHWLTAPGDTWANVASQVGVSHQQLGRANNITVTGSNTPALSTNDRVIHIPLVGP